MPLWTDVLDPATLTGYARASLADRERAQGTLARFLPNRLIPELIARFVTGSNGLLDAAEYRSWDAETPVTSIPGGQRVAVELPPLGVKFRVGEYEQLRLRGQDTQANVTDTLLQATNRVVTAVADRVEILRGATLATGVAAIAENGVSQVADYGRDPAFAVTAAKAWTDPDSSPLDDLRAWQEAYLETNGTTPAVALCSLKTAMALQNHPQFRQLAATLAGTPVLVTPGHVSNVLASMGLPPLMTYDRKARAHGVTQRILPEELLLLLPDPVDPNDWEGTQLGATFWGQTLESSQPGYQLAPSEQPGIVIGTYTDDDPVGLWIRSAAIALPILANANLSMVATVLAKPAAQTAPQTQRKAA